MIVRHGPDRGRERSYHQAALDVLQREDPELYRQLRFHETGTGTPDLEDVRAVLFWLADPLRERYPDCFAEAQTIADEAERGGARLLNPPANLSNTIKSVQFARWREAGIPTPEHRAFTDVGTLLEAARDFPYPAVIKADQLHAQEGIRLCPSFDAVEAIASEVICPGVLVAFEDTRHGEGVWSRYYHKKRLIVMGDVVHPRHIFFSEEPLVGLSNSTFGAYRRRRGQLRNHLLLAFRPHHRATIEADLAFAFAPPEHSETMVGAARALGLDMIAIDYAIRPDGSPVLWEANGHFYLPGPGRSHLPKVRKFERRYLGFARELSAFFRRALA